jgi:hypothetical protein
MIRILPEPLFTRVYKKTQGTISRTLKFLKQNYRSSIDLPLPPSRFVVAPTRIIREQRKTEKKKTRE